MLRVVPVYFHGNRLPSNFKLRHVLKTVPPVFLHSSLKEKLSEKYIFIHRLGRTNRQASKQQENGKEAQKKYLSNN